MTARVDACRLAMASLAVALMALLPACQAMRTRTFTADRAGALDAIATAMRQENASQIKFSLRSEPAGAPETEWRSAYFDDRETLGVIAFRSNQHVPPQERWRPFAPTEAGLAEARAFAREAGAGETGGWEVRVRVPRNAAQDAAPHAWGWTTGWRNETVPFDAGVCLRGACLPYEDVRAVRAVAFDRQSDPYPGSREGFMAALRDPVMDLHNSHLAVEVRMAGRRAARDVSLFEVSVLEDARICGVSSEYPLATLERCYAYADIADVFSVQDRHATLGEALADTATFPFRLVGAAAASAGIGAH